MRLKYNNYDSSVSARASYYEQMGLESKYGKFDDTSEQNNAMLEWMKKNVKLNKYSTGVHNLKRDELAVVHPEELIISRDGGISQVLKQGTTVVKPELSQRLLDMANNPSNFIMDSLKFNLPEFNRNVSGNNVEQNIAITIPLENVTDVNSFLREFQRNPKVEAIIGDVVASKLGGGNSLSKYRHKF